MSLVAPKTGNTFAKQEAVEAGTYPARLVRILSLGLQNQRAFEGQTKPPAYEIQLTYELLDEFMKDEAGNDIEDKPRWISETMPLRALDSDLAKSTKRYRVFDPENNFEGDFTKCLGVPVSVALGVNAKGYNTVLDVSIMRKRDADRAPELINESTYFDINNPDMKVFESLPNWVKEKMKENLEFKGSALEAALGGEVKETKKETPPKEEPVVHADDDEEEDLPF